MRYFLYGYYGQGNFGDDVLLRAMVDGIRGEDAAARFNVYSLRSVPEFAGDPLVRFTGLANYLESVRKRPWQLVPYFLMLARWLMHSDVLVIGGGTLFIDKGRFNVSLGLLYISVLLARLMGRRVVIAGVGVDRLTHPVSKWLTRQIFSAAEFVAVREASALPYVAHRPSEHTKLAADLALGLDLGDVPKRARARQTIGLCFIDYFRTVEVSERDHAAYEAAIFRMVEKYRHAWDFAWITSQRGVGQRDDWLVPRWQERYAEYAVLHVDSLESARAALAAVDVVVTTRFHLGLLGVIWGKPVIVIDHELKMASLFEDFQLPVIPIRTLVLGRDIDLECLLASYDQVATAGRLAVQRERVALNFRWLDAHGPN